MATIDSTQDYDLINTLTFSETGGTCPIRLYRGGSPTYSGTVYYREGTSGGWTSLSVSGTTTFPVTSKTMQVASDWNKDGNNYMTPSFFGGTTITGIAMSQKAALSGTIGNYFMHNYAHSCSSLTSLSIPATSSVTTIGIQFMYTYAYGCTSLTTLSTPDTSSVTTIGNYFMSDYVSGCSSLTTLGIPDTSSATTVGIQFMPYYASGCTSLTTLKLPAVGWFEDNNIAWGVPSSRLGYLKGEVIDEDDLQDWKDLTASTKTLYINYIRDSDNVTYTSTSTGWGGKLYGVSISKAFGAEVSKVNGV